MSLLRFLPRFKRAYRAIERLNEFGKQSREQIESFQLERLNQMWTLASSHVKYYSNLQKSLKLPRQFSSIAEFQSSIPILNKEQVRDKRELFLSNVAKDGRWLRTGGSTGVPTSVFWSNEAHLANLQMRYAWLSRYDVDIFSKQAFLWGHAGSFAPGLKGYLTRLGQPCLDRLRNRQRLSAYQVGASDLDRYLATMRKQRTTFVYGYSSAVLLLANRAIETSFELDGLKLLVMTGEPAMPYYAEQIKTAFKAPGRIEYGSVECGIIALENHDRNLEIQERSRMIETIDRGDGVYDIIVTILDNPSFPLFRYKIGDTTSSPLRKDAVGYATLENVQGRNNDFLVSRDGSFVHSNAVKHAMENVPYVTRFQAMQRLDGTLQMKVENDQLQDSIDEYAMQQKLRQLLGGYDVSIMRVHNIQGNLAGKHTWVVSELYEQIVSQSMTRPVNCTK